MAYEVFGENMEWKKSEKRKPASYVLLAKPVKPLAEFDSYADEDEWKEELAAYYLNPELNTMIADARCEHPAQIRLVK